MSYPRTTRHYICPFSDLENPHGKYNDELACKKCRNLHGFYYCRPPPLAARPRLDAFEMHLAQGVTLDAAALAISSEASKATAEVANKRRAAFIDAAYVLARKAAEKQYGIMSLADAPVAQTQAAIAALCATLEASASTPVDIASPWLQRTCKRLKIKCEADALRSWWQGN